LIVDLIDLTDFAIGRCKKCAEVPHREMMAEMLARKLLTHVEETEDELFVNYRVE